MSTLIIVQARLGSSRFPKKILEPLYGLTVLELVLKKCLEVEEAEKIVVAVPHQDKSEIKKIIGHLPVEIFDGSETDVLSRYYKCALEYSAKNICRITSDCPLIDSSLIKSMLLKYKSFSIKKYFANTCPLPSKFADGMDVEIFPFEYLKQAHEEESDLSRREHVTFQFWQDSKYDSEKLNSDIDFGNIRLTVDYEEDLDNLKLLGEMIGKKKILQLTNKEICEFISNNNLRQFYKPELRNIGWKNEDSNKF